MTKAEISTQAFGLLSSLTLICCYTSKVCRDYWNVSDEAVSHWSDIVKSACEEFADNADRLFMASALGKMTMNPVKTTVNLREFIQELMDDSSFFFKDSSEIIYTSSLDEDFTMEVDTHLLNTALLELLKNSIQSNQGGLVLLRTELDESGNMLCFYVTDKGGGIPVEHLEKVFDWFYKVDPYQSRMGIGLPLCREIAAIIGGDVFLDKCSFGGTRMCLRIPLTT